MRTKRDVPTCKINLTEALLATAAVWVINVWREIHAGLEVKQMTEKMGTYCVGRYLIDLQNNTKHAGGARNG